MQPIVKLVVVSLALGVSFLACSRKERQPVGPVEKVTVAIAALPDAALAQIAQAQGYYRQEGLDATIHLLPYGKPALDEVLAGKADFATVAETPVVFAALNGEKISILAMIGTTDVGNIIVGRKDRGISSPADLKGKRVAAPRGTTAEFFLDLFLVTQGIPRKDVTVVDLKAHGTADALVAGEVDAASMFSTYAFIAQKKLGNSAVVFRDKDIYRYTFNLVATQEFIGKNGGTTRKMLRALLRAEEFARKNPAEAQKIVAGYTRLQEEVLREIWKDNNYAVALDQTLILVLEDESEWAIKNGLTKGGKIPNYLDFVSLGPLQSLRPDAVRILR